MPTIYVISDLHTEFQGVSLPNLPHADICILAGDIGNPIIYREEYVSVLQVFSERYKDVVLVAGNHEYYDCKYDLEKVRGAIREIVNGFNNVHFLNREKKVIQGLLFVGATLWSRIRPIAVTFLNDFSSQVFHNQEEYIQEFERDYDYLKSALSEKQERPIVVVTHHLPTFGLIHPIYKNSSVNSAFFTEIVYLVNLNNVKLWACGHTHESMQLKIKDTIFRVNPLGYPHEKKVTLPFSDVINVE